MINIYETKKAMKACSEIPKIVAVFERLGERLEADLEIIQGYMAYTSVQDVHWYMVALLDQIQKETNELEVHLKINKDKLVIEKGTKC